MGPWPGSWRRFWALSGAISASTCWTSRWGAIELCGYTPEQLREYSHYPEKHFGQPHFLACYTDGPALLAVNKLRTVVRQTELAAYAAFRDADGNVTRGDMILGLNRLSSPDVDFHD